MTLLAGYLPEEIEEVHFALINAFNHAIEGKDPQAVKLVMRRGKKLQEEMRGVVARLLADDSLAKDMMKKLDWEIFGEETLALANDDDYRHLVPVEINLSGGLRMEYAVRKAQALGATLCLADAERILDNPGSFLPEWWAARKNFLFAGNLYRGKNGGIIYAPVALSEGPGKWRMIFCPLQGRMNSLFALKVEHRGL